LSAPGILGRHQILASHPWCCEGASKGHLAAPVQQKTRFEAEAG
jgi:hypothetical protein